LTVIGKGSEVIRSVMRCSDDVSEFEGQPSLLSTVKRPLRITTDAIEGFSEIYERQVQVALLFTALACITFYKFQCRWQLLFHVATKTESVYSIDCNKNLWMESLCIDVS